LGVQKCPFSPSHPPKVCCSIVLSKAPLVEGIRSRYNNLHHHPEVFVTISHIPSSSDFTVAKFWRTHLTQIPKFLQIFLDLQGQISLQCFLLSADPLTESKTLVVYTFIHLTRYDWSLVTVLNLHILGELVNCIWVWEKKSVNSFDWRKCVHQRHLASPHFWSKALGMRYGHFFIFTLWFHQSRYRTWELKFCSSLEGFVLFISCFIVSP
jgi:hypothetical protein